MVNDGETAVIGGLMSTNDTHFETGIPILSSIPFLGRFFKETEVRKDRRELLIFVTPRIVRGLASK
jgi:type II secretory pathway component HofQ